MPQPTATDHHPDTARPQDALARIDSALARIEAELARLDAGETPALAELRQRHSALRMAAASALAGIDALIAREESGPAKGESA
jgi:hypothetical protein